MRRFKLIIAFVLCASVEFDACYGINFLEPVEIKTRKEQIEQV